MDKTSVGILTFHFADNYGAVLQAYATKRFLDEKGYNAGIINYVPTAIYSNYDINPFHKKNISNSLKSLITYPYKRKQVRLFDLFRKEYLGVDNNEHTYDVVIVGSDQVWNLDITKGDKTYLLENIPDDVRRIGFGISLGRYDTDSLRRYIGDSLNSFYRLSFREKKSVDIVKSEFGINSNLVLDPVFLLSKESWKSISRRPNNFKDGDYILLYMLEHNSTLLNRTVEYAREQGLSIISIHPMSHRVKNRNVKNLNSVGPREFIWLVEYAEIVATNSFHGMAFSVVFNKNTLFTAHKQLGERNNNLIRIMGVDNPSDGMMVSFERCDYDMLNHLVEDTKQYLNDALR